MVFGWGKKRHEEESSGDISQEKEIRLSEIPEIVSELGHLRESRTLDDVRRLRDDTEPLIEELIKIGNVLEKDSLNVDDIDRHLAIIVVRGKKQVIDVIKKGIVHLPEVFSIADAKKLNSILAQILKKVGDVLGRQTRVIHIFAKKYANQLKENLEVMNSNQSAIHALLQSYDSEKAASDWISDALAQIKALNSARMEKIQKADGAARNKKTVTEKISSLRDSIKEEKSSDGYKKYLDLKGRLDAFGTQKSKIKNEINVQFTKISRPLSRYEYGSSLDKEQKNLLACLIRDPFDVISPQHKDPVIVILENVRKGISSGSISVKDVDKSMSYITETEEMLDVFVRQISEYMERHKKIKAELDSIYSDDLASMEGDLAKCILSQEDLELKSETFRGEIDEIDSRIPQIVSDIEQKLRRFSNTKYAILDGSV